MPREANGAVEFRGSGPLPRVQWSWARHQGFEWPHARTAGLARMLGTRGQPSRLGVALERASHMLVGLGSGRLSGFRPGTFRSIVSATARVSRVHVAGLNYADMRCNRSPGKCGRRLPPIVLATADGGHPSATRRSLDRGSWCNGSFSARPGCDWAGHSGRAQSDRRWRRPDDPSDAASLSPRALRLDV
jgi:hypothetical protein